MVRRLASLQTGKGLSVRLQGMEELDGGWRNQNGIHETGNIFLPAGWLSEATMFNKDNCLCDRLSDQ